MGTSTRRKPMAQPCCCLPAEMGINMINHCCLVFYLTIRPIGILHKCEISKNNTYYTKNNVFKILNTQNNCEYYIYNKIYIKR